MTIHHPINLPLQFEPVMTFARMPQPVAMLRPAEAAIIQVCTATEMYRAGRADYSEVVEAREAFLREVEQLGGNRDSFSDGVS